LAPGAQYASCVPGPDSQSRDRGRLFGSELEEGALHDPERLERQNDAEIDSINERAKHLKEVLPLCPRCRWLLVTGRSHR